MKIVFMGTPGFAVPCAEALWKAGHEIVAVFTQPDRPFGRKQVLKASEVKEWAIEKGLPVFQPEKIRVEENVEILKGLAPDIIVVVAYGQLLSQVILDIPMNGCINVHASLLPKYRGAAPINWAIIDGEKTTGVTTMFMAAGLDTGDMLMKKETAIEPEETAGMLHDRLSAMGADLIVETLMAIENKSFHREKQKDQDSCYASMLDKTLSKIDWRKNVEEIHNLVRGMNPRPIAWTEFDGKKMKIYSSSVFEKESENDAPGKIYAVQKDCIIVNCGIGRLEIKELQLEGGKRLETPVFLRGFAMEVGTFFTQS